MDRIAPLATAAAILVATAGLAAKSSTPLLTVVQCVVDEDDDDGDGTADGEQLRGVPSPDLARFPTEPNAQFRLLRVTPPDAVRVLVDGTPVNIGATGSLGQVRFQALTPGRHVVDLSVLRAEVRAVQILAIDGAGRPVDMTTSHASFQRTPPDRLDNVAQRTDDPDALRYVVVGSEPDLPDHVRIESRTEDGKLVDELRRAKLVDVACPSGTASGLKCRSTWPIRVVGDVIDQGHPLVADRSIRGALGGGLTIHSGSVAQQIRVGGPRHTKHGPMRRFRGDLGLTVVRTWPGGDASLESRDAAAVAKAREQLEGTNALWQQCGVGFGDPDKATVRVVDPPPPYLVAVGCDLGLPSSGGRISLTINDKDVSIEVPAGQTPAQAARRLARALEQHDLQVVRSSNSRIGPGTYPVVDLLVYRGKDRPARLSVPGGGPASTDPTLPVCIGRVDLAQGLRHFLDVDSMAGTVHERTLLKWVDDRDPSTVDGVFIPAFGGGGGRIGESFIGTDRSSLRNLVLVDRAGVAASIASHTLAHEVGHVLLDVPGHPDDYGVDEPTLLMDSDAANPSAFGPRRLTVEECERMWRQSGPNAPVELLHPWPLRPLSK